MMMSEPNAALTRLLSLVNQHIASTPGLAKANLWLSNSNRITTLSANLNCRCNHTHRVAAWWL